MKNKILSATLLGLGLTIFTAAAHADNPSVMLNSRTTNAFGNILDLGNTSSRSASSNYTGPTVQQYAEFAEKSQQKINQALTYRGNFSGGSGFGGLGNLFNGSFNIGGINVTGSIGQNGINVNAGGLGSFNNGVIQNNAGNYIRNTVNNGVSNATNGIRNQVAGVRSQVTGVTTGIQNTYTGLQNAGSALQRAGQVVQGQSAGSSAIAQSGAGPSSVPVTP